MTRDAAMAEQAAPFIAKLIATRAATARASDRTELIDFVATGAPNPLWLGALGDGLRRAGTTIEKADIGKKLAAVFASAASTAANAGTDPSARLSAITLLGFAPRGIASTALAACLAAPQPDDIQSAAITILAQQSSADVTATLLEHWPHYGAKAKAAALTALMVRDERATALLTAIQSGAIPPGALAAAQVQSLVHHKNTELAALAKTALTAVIPPSRAAVTAKFQPALAAKGDATRGQAVFMQRCFTCHQAAGQGMAVGPDLVTVKTKGRDALLTAILEPHKEVAAQFIAYTVNTKDGEVLSGIVTNDDATSLTLKMMGGPAMTIQRSNIKGTSSSGQSLMPEGLEAGLDVQGMADLLTFIEALP